MYNFRVYARNAIGLSSPSTPVLILAANKPAPPATPVLTPTVAVTVVIVDWLPPTDNQISLYGSAITEYSVFIMQSDGVTYTEVASDCPSKNADLLANTICTV